MVVSILLCSTPLGEDFFKWVETTNRGVCSTYILFMKKFGVRYTWNPPKHTGSPTTANPKEFICSSKSSKRLTSLWIYPPPGNSHHQHHALLVGNLSKPSFATGILGWGARIQTSLESPLFFPQTNTQQTKLRRRSVCGMTLWSKPSQMKHFENCTTSQRRDWSIHSGALLPWSSRGRSSKKRSQI